MGKLAEDSLGLPNKTLGRQASESSCAAAARTTVGRLALLTCAESQIPVGHIGDAEDVALTAVFLSSPRARHITGEVVYIDGGAKR